MRRRGPLSWNRVSVIGQPPDDSQRSKGAKLASRPRKSWTSSAAGFEPPGSSTALRYLRAGAGVEQPLLLEGREEVLGDDERPHVRVVEGRVAVEVAEGLVEEGPGHVAEGRVALHQLGHQRRGVEPLRVAPVQLQADRRVEHLLPDGEPLAELLGGVEAAHQLLGDGLAGLDVPGEAAAAPPDRAPTPRAAARAPPRSPTRWPPRSGRSSGCGRPGRGGAGGRTRGGGCAPRRGRGAPAPRRAGGSCRPAPPRAAGARPVRSPG